MSELLRVVEWNEDKSTQKNRKKPRSKSPRFFQTPLFCGKGRSYSDVLVHDHGTQITN